MKCKSLIAAFSVWSLAACGIMKSEPVASDVVQVYIKKWGSISGLTINNIRNLECHQYGSDGAWECEFDYTKPAQAIFGKPAFPARNIHKSIRLQPRDDGSWTYAR